MPVTTDVTGEAITNSAVANCGWSFVVLMSRQGKIRLSEFFESYTESEKRRILRDIAADILVCLLSCVLVVERVMMCLSFCTLVDLVLFFLPTSHFMY